MIDPNAPAYPNPDMGEAHYGDRSAYPGMTIRAAMAMQESIAEFDHPDSSTGHLGVALAGPKPEGGWVVAPLEMLQWEAKWRAAIKVLRADALIAELNKEKS